MLMQGFEQNPVPQQHYREAEPVHDEHPPAVPHKQGPGEIADENQEQGPQEHCLENLLEILEAEITD